MLRGELVPDIKGAELNRPAQVHKIELQYPSSQGHYPDLHRVERKLEKGD